MFESEKQALKHVFKLPCATMGESLLLAAIYAAQAVLCAALLTLGYTRAHAPDMGWAIISAILVLQPGIAGSLAASVARILANIVGVAVSLSVVQFLGLGLWQLLIAILIIVFLCELLHLDMGLRAACVSAVIVMTFRESDVFRAGLNRSMAVIIGSVLAVLVQIAGSRLKHLVFRSQGRHELPAGSQ